MKVRQRILSRDLPHSVKRWKVEVSESVEINKQDRKSRCYTNPVAVRHPANCWSRDWRRTRRNNETENRVELELKAGNNTVLLASAKSTSHSSSVHYGSDVLTTVLPDCHLTEYNSDSAALLEFTTLKAETLEERLQRFQLVMLDTKQIEEFENHFEAGVRFESPNYIWLSWLQIKLATIGSEKSDKRKTSWRIKKSKENTRRGEREIL